GRVGDHRLGYAAAPPGLRVVDAVVASCAHPPWFPADGGVYDNLGLEPVWTDHGTVLVSGGGAVFRGQPAGSVLGRLWRLLSIAAGGGHTTRLWWLRSAFSAGLLHGATWSLEAPTSVSGVPGHGLPAGVGGAYPDDVVGAISRVRTDLDAFTTEEQHVLERHGYVVADASLRAHSPRSSSPSTRSSRPTPTSPPGTRPTGRSPGRTG
ncbi:MAG: patatin-like phospholipase family protein, partial [Actinobacteria bacterium]|nr:patatin-like phospholipase family protein [Actinomycetota bacterium]